LARKEDEFHLEQAKVRALTRLKENRAKPVDHLYAAVNPADLPLDKIILSPAKVLKSLSGQQLEELKQEIPLFIELDSAVDYWKSILVLLNNQLATLKDSSNDFTEDAVHTAVTDDIKTILDGKTENELEELEQNINQQINSGKAIDEEYWQALLKTLKIQKSYAKVDEMHLKIVDDRLALLAKQENVRPETLRHLRKCMRDPNFPENHSSKSGNATNRFQQIDGYQLTGSIRGMRKILSEDEMYDLEEAKGMEEDEEKFSQEFILPNAASEASQGLVKPKYYNRVKTGYEWNKYNQVHYDLDSPPPKVVQGYKFNIFYPELIDKNIPPTYKIHPTENPDLVILHFLAGPPYQEIAFKIVNGEWEYSQKTGFRCMYSNGILHLWFNFKKYRYRR
jgi:hypothetical protein